MDAFEQWAAAEGCALIALATRRAAPFYRALGYEESAAYFRKVLVERLINEELWDNSKKLTLAEGKTGGRAAFAARGPPREPGTSGADHPSGWLSRRWFPLGGRSRRRGRRRAGRPGAGGSRFRRRAATRRSCLDRLLG